MRWKSCLIALLTWIVTIDTGRAELKGAVTENDWAAFNGEWIYVEDRTSGRELDRLGPAMSSKFSMRVDEGVLVLEQGHGSGHRGVRIQLDGAMTEVAEGQKRTRYKGSRKDNAVIYEVDFIREPGTEPTGLIHREFRITKDGLEVRASSGSPASAESVSLYLHAEDIALPLPAPSSINDLSWMSGAWVGTRSSGSSIEERWSPPLGGTMLAISRTVSRGKMSAFEYLRIMERDGGLIYVAQPNGGAPTEFVLTEFSKTRAVFDNPRHDYPKRIVYELTEGGRLQATIGFMKGGTPRRFEYQREHQ